MFHSLCCNSANTVFERRIIAGRLSESNRPIAVQLREAERKRIANKFIVEWQTVEGGFI